MALGILIAIFLALMGLAGLAAAPQKLGMVAFLVIAALSPFIYGVIEYSAFRAGAGGGRPEASVMGVSPPGDFFGSL